MSYLTLVKEACLGLSKERCVWLLIIVEWWQGCTLLLCYRFCCRIKGGVGGYLAFAILSQKVEQRVGEGHSRKL